jgi:pimeloyl-ACP methyl ester carboxylesterase
MIDRRVWSIFVLAFGLWAGCATTQGESESGADATASSNNAQAEDGRDGTDAKEATGEGEKEASESKPAYDARLSSYEYPYEVQTRNFEAQGKTREMAYMDVEPEEPNGQTVVLLHGKNFSGAYWERTIAHLVEQGYRVVAPDQIGFGKSSKPTDFQYTFQALATHTRGLLEARGIEQANVVGHSMGGMLATRFALMFPGFTESLTLVNPIGLEDWKRKVPYQTVDQWYDRELDKTPAGIRDYMRQSYFDGEWKEAYDPLVEIQAGWTRGPDYERIARVSALTYDMVFTQPVLYEFGDLNVETLLIIGQRDRTALGTNLVPPDVAKTMGRYDKLDERTASEIPNSRLVELEGIGHIPQFEAFDRYIEELTGFLEE